MKASILELIRHCSKAPGCVYLSSTLYRTLSETESTSRAAMHLDRGLCRRATKQENVPESRHNTTTDQARRTRHFRVNNLVESQTTTFPSIIRSFLYCFF